MHKKLKLRISVIKTALLIWLFLSGYAFADLSNEVKWNANLVVVEAAIKAGDYRDAFSLLQGPAKEGHAKSQYYMGMFYHNGLGVLEDVVEGETHRLPRRGLPLTLQGADLTKLFPSALAHSGVGREEV